jgi:hypothetical protein
MSQWTPEQNGIIKATLNLLPVERYAAYIAKFGENRTPDAVERQARRLRTVSKVKALVDESVLQDEEEETSSAKLAVTGYPQHKQTSEAKKQVESFIEELLSRTEQIKFSDIEAPSTGSTLCVLLSDTHIGKQTKTFNKEVFVSRLLSIPQKLGESDLLPIDIEEIVLILAGDMLEGEGIYETQSHHLEMPAIDQMKIAVDTIWQLALKLVADFNLPVRIVTCPGNHGRVSKTASEKTNWDNLIYQTLGYLINLQQNPMLTIDVNFESFYTFPVQDKVGMIYHHGTKHLGTPAMQSKVSGWLFTKKFDFMCHGHWHHWSSDTQFGKLVMKNGSLPGSDDLSERMGVYDPPRQGWFIVRSGQPINQMGWLEWSEE